MDGMRTEATTKMGYVDQTGWATRPQTEKKCTSSWRGKYRKQYETVVAPVSPAVQLFLRRIKLQAMWYVLLSPSVFLRFPLHLGGSFSWDVRGDPQLTLPNQGGPPFSETPLLALSGQSVPHHLQCHPARRSPLLLRVTCALALCACLSLLCDCSSLLFISI